MKKLIGRSIGDASIHQGTIYLLTTDGLLELEPDGDCCAHCYIQHVSGADALFGATVASVEQIDGPQEVDELRGGDVVDQWGYRVTTNKGVCSIEMRLEHNGYYGGRLYVHGVGCAPEGAVRLDDF